MLQAEALLLPLVRKFGRQKTATATSSAAIHLRTRCTSSIFAGQFHRRREHATDTHPFYYIGLRFDLELTGPLSLSQLDLKDNLYVGPHANQNTGPPAHRIATLRVSVPDFMVVADWERFTIWMTRGIAYELLYLPPPRSLRGSPGVPDRFPMLHAPEAFLARWLYLNGITHGQPATMCRCCWAGRVCCL